VPLTTAPCRRALLGDVVVVAAELLRAVPVDDVRRRDRGAARGAAERRHDYELTEIVITRPFSWWRRMQLSVRRPPKGSINADARWYIFQVFKEGSFISFVLNFDL
jgi:hypothetical protein